MSYETKKCDTTISTKLNKTSLPLIMEKMGSKEWTEKLGNRPTKAKNEKDRLPIKQKIHRVRSSCKARKIMLLWAHISTTME